MFYDGSIHEGLVLGIIRRPVRMAIPLLLKAVLLALLMLAGAPASSSAFQPTASSGRNVHVATLPLGGGQASWLSQLPQPASYNHCYHDDDEPNLSQHSRRRSTNSRSRMPSQLFASAKKSTVFELMIDLPPSNSDVQAVMGIDPILSVPSELVVVRYRVPFGLNVEPRKNLAVVTKAGPGGEQPGDVLRYCSQWTLGLPKGDGLVTTAAAFSGGLSWQCSMFNVVKAKAWEQVVQALTSNTETRTDEMVMIFERAMDGVTPPELQ